MSHWWTYPLADVLPFSLQAYARLLESYAAAVWPLQLFGLVAGMLILAAMLGYGWLRNNIPIGLFSLMWLWIAVVFFEQHYSALFWAASWFAIMFGIQVAILFGFALKGLEFSRDVFRSCRLQLGAALFVFAFAVYPLIGSFAWSFSIGTEFIGVTPDPTSIATLAVLASLEGRMRWFAMIIPAIWLIVSGAILWTLGSSLGIVPIVCAGLAVLIALMPSAPALKGPSISD